jgi:hypothetical protein
MEVNITAKNKKEFEGIEKIKTAKETHFYLQLGIDLGSSNNVVILPIGVTELEVSDIGFCAYYQKFKFVCLTENVRVIKFEFI